jgi:hydroxymethylglutaryl-CoA reductase (NADPH)
MFLARVARSGLVNGVARRAVRLSSATPLSAAATNTAYRRHFSAATSDNPGEPVVDDSDLSDESGDGERSRVELDILDGEVTDSSKSGSFLLHSLASYTDDELSDMVLDGEVSQYKLERALKTSLQKGAMPDCGRAVRVRRLWLTKKMEMEKRKAEEEASTTPTSVGSDLKGLPYHKFEYETFYQDVLGTNCENVIGYVPLPVGFVGPMLLNGKKRYVPMATTEGALLASTNRGCRAITESGGAHASVFDEGMTRAPVVQLPTAMEAVELKVWLSQADNLQLLKDAFATTTRFGALVSADASIAGRNVYIRFKCTTGDAMGMNMISKGSVECMKVLEAKFPKMTLLSLSGNVCTDKKAAAINWVKGRGKSVVCEVELDSQVIVNVLKCTPQSLIQVNTAKNLVGSAVAGAVGGFNAHASNVVTACFLATGQDPAQNVSSSNCITLMESIHKDSGGEGLRVSVTMPSMEVGTVGGGTALAAQRASLELLGVAGPNMETPGENARELSKIIAGTVLAGEISLMSALASNHLVSAHMKLNR